MRGFSKSGLSWGFLLSSALTFAQPAHGEAPDTQITLGQIPQNAPPADSRRPNIVFILTDDQDLHMNSLDYLPLINKHIIEQGTLFEKHFCTTAICCPARVTLWTGKAAHNTNVTDVSPPYGRKFLYCLQMRRTGQQTNYTNRRISQVRQPGPQRQLPPRLPTGRRLQHLLHGKALQRPRRHKL